MNALEFLDAAIRMSNSAREADRRSAVSRAYYGVSHLALEFVQQAKISLPASASVHEKLTWLLGCGASPQIVKAGAMLDSLRKSRNTADYNLKATQFHDPSSIRTHIISAQEVVSALASCNAEPARFEIHAKMRAYAKNTLRLTVSDRPNRQT